MDEDSGKSEPGYDFYPDRRHLEEEFHKLWRAQESHHLELTDVLRDLLFETIFYQRPLKEAKVGRCLFHPEDRLAKTHPLTQQRVLYETVNNLRITANGRASRPLTLEQRDQIIFALNGKEPLKSPGGTKMSLDALAKVLKLKGEKFTLETAARDTIACDPVRASLTFKDRFGARWSTLDWQKQCDLIQRCQNAQSDQQVQDLIQWLIDTHHLSPDQARATADAPLPEGYSRLGLTATKAVLDKLKSDVLTYDKAVAAIARAVVASGLHPTIGIFHSNRSNAFALADDLMEPFRPLVDLTARAILSQAGPEVTSAAKQSFARLIALDLPLTGETSPIAVALSRRTTSLAQSFEARTLALALPEPPPATVLGGLGQ